MNDEVVCEAREGPVHRSQVGSYHLRLESTCFESEYYRSKDWATDLPYRTYFSSVTTACRRRSPRVHLFKLSINTRELHHIQGHPGSQPHFIHSSGHCCIFLVCSSCVLCLLAPLALLAFLVVGWLAWVSLPLGGWPLCVCARFLWCGFSHFRTPTIFSHIFGKTLGLVDMAAAHYSLSQGRLVSRHASNNPHEKEEQERAGLDLAEGTFQKTTNTPLHCVQT